MQFENDLFEHPDDRITMVISADKKWLHFAFDNNRDCCVHYSAKLPPLR